ncbi:hypothetical protein D1007_55865 [Hordeum vulgare]|nr:hypothetical protein D1007_55865 [Hordeum vulgare]
MSVAFYRKARRRLRRSQHRRPPGLCVGLLDPVSNIVINSLISSCNHGGSSRCCKGVQQDLERRSLDGLVAFLTRLFPNLAESLAVHYLRLADALVAARIIVFHHGMKRFDDSEPAVLDMAPLKCAALAVGHPDPDRLVHAWRTISVRMNDALRLLALLREPPSRRYYGTGKLDRMLNTPPSRRSHIISMLAKMVNDGPSPGCEEDALARLPAGSRFHRSLLKAGYCYGPLDPVSNIIVNTVWHDTAFPPTMKLELDLDVIGTQGLHRVENRSLYGLASFLCTRYHRFDFHQAVKCLLQADANLVQADPNLAPFAPSTRPTAAPTRNVLEPQEHPDTSIEKAFLAAATAASHPKPRSPSKASHFA